MCRKALRGPDDDHYAPRVIMTSAGAPATSPRPARRLLVGLVAAGVAVAVTGAAPPAQAAAADPVISEVSAANLSGARDEVGDVGDWVEIANPGPVAVDLSGWGLSNADKNPFRWVFPAGTRLPRNGFLRVWTDKADRRADRANLHTSFGLDNGDDSVVLTAPDGTDAGRPVDSVALPLLAPDTSWCRTPGGGAAAAFTTCLAPTPGARNAGRTAALPPAAPVLSRGSGVSRRPVTVTASGPAGATLRYTTDGSLPTPSSRTFPRSMLVATTTTLRVAAFAPGAAPSPVVSATYVVDPFASRWAGQRLLFLSMAPADRIGYLAGLRAPTQGWRGHAGLVEPDGTTVFSAEVVLEDAGQIGSRVLQRQLPLDVKLRDALGVKDVEAPVFSAVPDRTTFDRFRLRNGGTDYYGAHLRDQFWQSLGRGTGLAPSASEPVHVFLDGSYRGMMDLREKEDEKLVAAEYDVDDDAVSYLSDRTVLSGERAVEDYDAAVAYVTGRDMSVAANYARATRLLDVENFAKDFALHLFAASPDWQDRNVHAFKADDYDGRWRFRPHDFDISGGGPNPNPISYDVRAASDQNDEYTAGTPGRLMKSLLRNPEFKRLYATVIADQLNTALDPASSTAALDAMAARMAPYMPEHVRVSLVPLTTSLWRRNVDTLRTFLRQRPAYYVDDTRRYLRLGRLTPLTVATSDAAAGTVDVGTLDLSGAYGPATSWTGRYWADVPVDVTARPAPGFRFVRWTGAARGTDPHLRVKAAGQRVEAVFAPLATPAAPVVDAVAPRLTATTGVVVSLPLAASDPNGYRLRWEDEDLPPGLSVHPVTGLVFGRPTRAGTYDSVLTATNGPASTSVRIRWVVSNRAG